MRAELIHSCDEGFEAARQAILDRPEWIEQIDGVFAQADITAMGVIAALRELGVRVPDDLPVVGYDDIRMARIGCPPLTTVHQPQEALESIDEAWPEG